MKGKQEKEREEVCPNWGFNNLHIDHKIGGEKKNCGSF